MPFSLPPIYELYPGFKSSRGFPRSPDEDPLRLPPIRELFPSPEFLPFSSQARTTSRVTHRPRRHPPPPPPRPIEPPADPFLVARPFALSSMAIRPLPRGLDPLPVSPGRRLHTVDSKSKSKQPSAFRFAGDTAAAVPTTGAEFAFTFPNFTPHGYVRPRYPPPGGAGPYSFVWTFRPRDPRDASTWASVVPETEAGGCYNYKRVGVPAGRKRRRVTVP